jgi:hypothetical protein
LFTLAIVFENRRSVLGYFFPQSRLCIIFGKNMFGNILGDFFTNSSGHPDFAPIFALFHLSIPIESTQPIKADKKCSAKCTDNRVTS